MPNRRNLAAGIPVGALVALYLAFLATGNLLSPRAMAAAALLMTGATSLLLADDHDPPAVSWITPILALPAVVCATLALAFPPTLLLTITTATTLALWTIQLALHLTFADGWQSGACGPVVPAGLGAGVADADHVVHGGG
ncbi:hypothetical protein ACQPYH_28490 [Kribbella sp. CA-245084]|uniref:hypothetical protein n=1 Tax=Kribbella sp. CA-245084 TaxID=3239940 RepID=UPI003D8D5616